MVNTITRRLENKITMSIVDNKDAVILDLSDKLKNAVDLLKGTNEESVNLSRRLNNILAENDDLRKKIDELEKENQERHDKYYNEYKDQKLKEDKEHRSECSEYNRQMVKFADMLITRLDSINETLKQIANRIYAWSLK